MQGPWFWHVVQDVHGNNVARIVSNPDVRGAEWHVPFGYDSEGRRIIQVLRPKSPGREGYRGEWVSVRRDLRDPPEYKWVTCDHCGEARKVLVA